MIHKQFEEMLPFYINGTLSDDERAAFEAHIVTCEHCQATFDAEFDEWIDLADAAKIRARHDPVTLPPLTHRKHRITWITTLLFGNNNKGDKIMISATTLRPALTQIKVARWATFVLILFLGGSLLFAFLPEQEHPTTIELLRAPAEVNADVFQRYIDEGWNIGNVNLLDTLLTENVICNAPFMTEEAVGIADIKDMITNYRFGLPDLHLTIDAMNADNETVWAQVTLTGTHTDSLALSPDAAFAPTDNPVDITQIIVAHFNNGQITEIDMAMDSLALMQQLGVTSSLDQLAIEQQNMATTRRFVEEIWGSTEAVTADQLAEFLDPCEVVHEPYESDPFRETTVCVSQGTLDFVNSIKKAFPEFTYTIDQLTAKGDMTFVHWTMRGVRSGWFGLTLPSHEEEIVDMTFISRYEDGKSVETWAYWIAPFIYEEAYR